VTAFGAAKRADMQTDTLVQFTGGRSQRQYGLPGQSPARLLNSTVFHVIKTHQSSRNTDFSNKNQL